MTNTLYTIGPLIKVSERGKTTARRRSFLALLSRKLTTSFSKDQGPISPSIALLRDGPIAATSQIDASAASERIHDNVAARQADLIQLAQIASTYPSRERFLTELTLDPPNATSDEAGAPLLDEDYLILCKRGANHAQPLSPASHAPLIGKSTSAAGARTRLPR